MKIIASLDNQLCNEFFLNRISVKRREQTHSQQANGKTKKAISESTVKRQRIEIRLKLEITDVLAHDVTDCEKTLPVQVKKRVLLMYFIPLFL